MPDRLKNSGHYCIKFFVTPDEFRTIMAFFDLEQTKFVIPNYERTTHHFTQVQECYDVYYHYYVSEEKGERPDCLEPVYHIDFSINSEESSGFFLRCERLQFPNFPIVAEDGLSYQANWADDTLPCLLLTFQKGVPIFLEDEKGKYYIYEKSQEHWPLKYTFFVELSNHIKGITKPFTFFAPNAHPYEMQKPSSARISKDALNQISNGWVFKKYQLKILDAVKRKQPEDI